MYVSQYELSGRPFQLTADPRFYFESATHRKAMSYLGYGLAQGEGFIVITGDEGAGKSTLVAQLMATIDPQRLAAVRIICSDMDGETLLRRTAHAFGIATDGVEKRHVLSRIEAYMHHQARAGRRSLLIVDEAHALPLDALEALRQLSNFQLGGQSLVQIFLFGRTGFRDFVRAASELEPLRQRIIASHHLEPLQGDEIGSYLEHRLKVVGWVGRPAFTPQAIASLGGASGGVPSRLNHLVGSAMECAASVGSDRIDADMVVQAAAQLGTVIASPAPVDPEPVVMPHLVADPAPEPDDEPARLADDVQAMRAEVQSLRAAIGQTAHSAQLSVMGATDAGRLEQRLAQVEARLAEQDDMLRHILSRLLEWIDREAAGEAVAHRAA